MGVLLTAAYCDLRKGKIYNWLTYPAIVLGLLLAATGGWDRFVNHAQGMFIGGGVLFIGFLLRGMGGGDVKLMAAVGAIYGAFTEDGELFILYALFYSLVAGAAIGLMKMVWRGASLETAKRLWTGLGLMLVPGVRPDEAIPKAQIMVPFGLAVCIGTLWCLMEAQAGSSLWDFAVGLFV
jgi:prepilin peptidase CpaA